MQNAGIRIVYSLAVVEVRDELDDRRRTRTDAEPSCGPAESGSTPMILRTTDQGDTTTSGETLIAAAEQIETVRPGGHGLIEVVADKGYHSNESLVDLEARLAISPW